MAEAAKKDDLNALLATPEAQKLIAEAAQQAVAQALKGAAPAIGGDTETTKLFSEMALAIAQMSNQGSGRVKPLAPEVLQKREAAAVKLGDAILEMRRMLAKAKHEGDMIMLVEWTPKYRVTAKCYFGEQFIEPYRRGQRRDDPAVANEIEWTGCPNDALKPLNKVAERLTDLYRESVGAAPRLSSMSGPNGGQVAQDSRPYWMTPGGCVVIGMPTNPKATVFGSQDMARNEPQTYDNEDPNAPTVRILGTVAEPAKRSTVAAFAGQTR